MSCEKLIHGLRGYPVVVVSGLAIGIDSISHHAALDAGLETVAFPGSGLAESALYPASRRKLAHRIVDSGGALISPFPYEQPGALWTFPVRNQLMAGMSHATLIIEARKGSGTLITAEHALEFSRDVLAVPGSIFSDLSYGPHMLLSRGAAPASSSEDILRALGLYDASLPERRTTVDLEALSLSSEERSICESIRSAMLTSSDIIEKTALPASEVTMLITGLELRDIVVEQSGTYRLKNS